MTTSNWRTLFTCDTLCNADSVEWCPIEPYQDRFVCGTYQQVEEEESSEVGRKRKGTILLFRFTGEELKRECCVDTAAVLDMKWSMKRISDEIALAVADGDGKVSVYYLTDGNLNFITDRSIRDDGHDGDYLSLSLGWSPGDDCEICSSDSRGNVTLLKFRDGNLVIVRKWNAHSMEAWITCFDAFDPRIIYTGGDDLKLNIWDLRSENPRKAFGVSRHGAGVTVLSPHPNRKHCLASGSYDETILLWDTRNWKNPVGEIAAGGGLWRLKWKPDPDSRYLLAACIYGGFEIVSPFENSSVGRYKEHSSLAYGADWSSFRQCQNLTSGETLMATCSFYDKKLCVSLWDGNEIASDVP